MKKQLLPLLVLFFFCAKTNAQITLTDTGHCVNTTLYATLVGETPINASITADDVYSSVLPIGFTFNFYGTPVTQLIVGANGNISFNVALAGGADPYSISAPLLGNASVLDGICGPWADMDIYYTGTPIGIVNYSTVGVAPNRKFIVEYCHNGMYSCSSLWITSQVILYETTNNIEVHIGSHIACTTWNGGYAIIGVQNATGSAATAAPGRDFPSVWSAADEAWRFTPVGSASYSVSSIPYSPVPYASSTITWVNTSTGTAIGTGTSIVVTPTVTTTYEAYATGCDDTAKAFITVSPGTGPPITGTPTVCIGDTTDLTDATTGGTWSSTNTSVAQVTATGKVFGLSAGTTTISYIIDTACSSTLVVTVNTTPTGGVILGSGTVCVGSTITLSDTISGGVWTSTNNGIATVGSSTGVVTGIANGIDSIKYTVTNACGSATVFTIITVNPIPAAITGSHVVCIGLTTNLSDVSSGGTWSSSNTSVATISSSGLVTGASVGTTTITYKYTGTGCYNTFTFTVDPVPTAINGTLSVCVGGTSPLTDAVTGGTWFSSNTGVATVVGSTGVVTGVAVGTATIFYIIGSSACEQTAVVTVNPTPTAITGSMTVCVGLTTNLTDGVSGGTWSSNNTLVATVGTSGIVTGISSGTAIITYQMGASCYVTATVTVNSAPSVIDGTKIICVGATTTLTDSIGGGTWSSSNIVVATVGSGTGVVTGNGAGTATITYTTGTGCSVTTTVTVNPNPTAINPSGPVSICLFGNTSLSDATAGGTWSSSNTTIAVVGTSGTVTGLAIGTSNISYILSTGCYVVKTVTVNNAPTPISPSSALICTGSTITLSDTTSGGVWSSSNIGVATVSGGIVTGVGAGIATITYAIGTCYAFATVSVIPTPAAITPVPATVCLGSTTSLTDATSGGIWSSSASGIASVTSGGVVTGNGIGTAIISYTSGSCSATTVVTVNTAPGAILPPNPTVCTGSTTTLTDATSGGVWSSSAPGTASVSGDVVTGVATGTATISYSIGTCSSTTTITVNASPAPITPTPVTICLGGNTTLTDATAGGAWSSSVPGTASITAGGVVTGNAVGTATILYTVAGCSSTTIATINTAPGAILPSSPQVCTGSTITLTDATSGGVWSSGSPAIALVSGSGVVTGSTAGTATISYSIGTCSSTTTVTVNQTPFAITPTPVTICLGGNTTLTDATAGGAWSSSAPGTASITAGGVVTGNAVGTATILYTLAGCSATTIATVNTAPGAISPSSPQVCTGGTITLSDATGGGVWSSSNPGTASVSGGVVTGVIAGTATISYSIGSCSSTTTVTVNATPSAINPAPISLCIGNSTTLTDATGGGAWSSSTPSVATISAGGLITAVSPGTATIFYTVGSCSANIVATVNTTPAAISPAAPSVCLGSTTTLSDIVGGGVWSSTATGTATISGTGVVTGITTGTATISYVIGTCSTATTITVNPVPTPINPTPASVCQGGAVTLTDATGGGAWSSNAPGTASITAGGVVTGVAIGTATIAYTNGFGCSATTVVTVTTLGTAGTILGPLTICQGSFDIYIDFTAGGVWSMSNGLGVISSVGVVDALSPGADTVIYTVTNVCGSVSTTKAITIVPATVGAGIITGPSNVCVGSSITLSDATAPGGTWSSTNVYANIGSATGIVTGVSAGLDTIIYTLTTVCGTYTTSATVNVDATSTPSPISGPSTVCVASNITLSDADAGGAYSSSNAHGTIVPGTGVMTGVTPGLDTITYTTINGCGLGSTTKIITVLPSPSAGVITGPSTVCPGSAINLTDAVSGGTWSASNGNATVGTSGHVSGVTAGTDDIIYTITTSCGTANTTKTITVNPLPDAGTILGPDSVCIGSTITLLDFSAGGTWSAGNSNASVGTTGIVTGLSVGTDPISYSVTNTCGTTYTSKIITVSTIGDPGVITGISNVCVGSAITLTDTAPGGIWLSSNGTAMLVGPGIVSGISPGIDSIFYVVINSCGTNEARKIIDVNPIPVVPVISGATSQCVGTIITLTDGLSGGDWSSSDPTIASVNLISGSVTGLASGIVTITYNVTNVFGCSANATSPDTVNMIPSVSPITGASNICLGSTTALTDATTGGVWSSSNVSVATVDVSGNVTGAAAGTATISYTVSNMCGATSATYAITVNPLPVVAAITGATNECVGSITTLTDATGGGTWSSSDTTIATVNSSIGEVTGIASGVVNIIYSVTNTFGCSSSVTTSFTVNALPVVAAITGVTNACIGSGTALSDVTGGGVWMSSDNTIATIDASGNVTGISAGTVTIFYKVTNGSGCIASATTIYTVNAIPVATPITGTLSVCQGLTTVLSNTLAGGVWSSNDNTIATIDAVTGIVTGVAAGSDIIIYTVSNSCGSIADSATITINSIPVVAPITASFSTVCTGTSITLSDATVGGMWISINPAIATVSSTGIATGIATGTDTIMYAMTNSFGCSGEATYVITVAPALSTVAVVPASATLCHGNPVNMHVSTTSTGMTYQWLLNGNVIPGATNSSYNTDSAGTYSLVVNNGTCSETIAGTVVSLPPNPVISFTSPNILYTGSFFSYQWFKNGVAIPGATSSLYHETGSGLYSVVVTDINGCTDTSAGYTIHSGTTGVGTTQSVADIRIYPNPATSVLTIDAPEKVNISLLSVDGKVLIEQKDATTIDVSMLPNGLYLIMIYDENNILMMNSKFVKTAQ